MRRSAGRTRPDATPDAGALRQGRQPQSQMTDSTLETVLAARSLVVGGAIGIIVALAWGYVLWLANDMDMGGMDMTGFRMTGRDRNHVAGQRAMASDRVRVCVPDVGGDDGRDDGALGSAHDPHVRPRGSTGESAGQAVRRDRLVCGRLSSRLERLFAGSDLAPMGDRAGGLAGFPDGDRQQLSRRNRPDRGGSLSMDTAQGRLSRPMPDAVAVPDAPRRLSRTTCEAACCWGFGTEAIVSAAAGF